jgi:hypothetical protein
MEHHNNQPGLLSLIMFYDIFNFRSESLVGSLIILNFLCFSSPPAAAELSVLLRVSSQVSSKSGNVASLVSRRYIYIFLKLFASIFIVCFFSPLFS